MWRKIKIKVLSLFVVILIPVFLTQNADATIDFCGGPDTFFLDIKYSATNPQIAALGLGDFPIAASGFKIDFTNGLVLNTVFGPIASCQQPPSLPTCTNQDPNDNWMIDPNTGNCSCATDLAFTTLVNGTVIPKPTQSQKVFVGYFNDPSINDQTAYDFQDFPDPAKLASYNQIINTSTPGQWAPSLGATWVGSTTINPVTGEGSVILTILIPYMPGATIPGDGTFSSHAYTDSATPEALNCDNLWVAKPHKIKFVP